MSTFLISCAGSKQLPMKNKSKIDLLAYNDILGEARLDLINLTGIELDWDFTLPAWKLYSGNRSRLFRQIDQSNWEKPNAEIKILSALFGWIKHTDLIPYYNLKMDEKRGPNNQYIWKIWYDKGILRQVNINAVQDYDLLSNLYRRAINKTGNQIAQVPDEEFTEHYGTQKGKWLNKQLNLI